MEIYTKHYTQASEAKSLLFFNIYAVYTFE